MYKKSDARQIVIKANQEIKRKAFLKTMVRFASVFSGNKEEKNEPIENPDNRKRNSTKKKNRIAVINNYDNIYHSKLHECCYCGNEISVLDDVEYTIDHLVPLSIGGSTRIENLKPCCLNCNREKAQFTIDEWLNILYREFERAGGMDPYLLYRYMRVQAIKKYVDRMGSLLYK